MSQGTLHLLHALKHVCESINRLYEKGLTARCDDKIRQPLEEFKILRRKICRSGEESIVRCGVLRGDPVLIAFEKKLQGEEDKAPIAPEEESASNVHQLD